MIKSGGQVKVDDGLCSFLCRACSEQGLDQEALLQMKKAESMGQHAISKVKIQVTLG